MRPLVSIVMPVFNGERYLREAIDSILNQTFNDFEFIIIDDGSKDSSASIVKSYSDPRLRFIQQENAGVASALNVGIEQAKGEYVARMDADDISHEDRLKLQYDYMNNHSNVDILGGHAYLIDENGDAIGEKLKPVASKTICKAIEYACPVIHPTYMVRKDVYSELNGYRVCFPPGEDYDFLLRAYDAGKIIENLDQFLLYYRVITQFSRPARDRYQMFLTRMVLKLHKQRIGFGQENSSLLKKIERGSNADVSLRFSLAYRWRNALLIRAKRIKGINYFITMLAVMFVSFADYELFCSSMRGILYKRACVEN